MLIHSIGVAGQPWSAVQIAQWRALLSRKRSYASDVVVQINALSDRFDVVGYGDLAYPDDRYQLLAVRSKHWERHLPVVLITGGVHGYETSGVQGALRFLENHAQAYSGEVNLLVVPCASPWAYERVQRWNFDALDPNRAFREGGAAQEAAALMRLIAPVRGEIAMHIDLHETTDSDESEFRPALAARDGKAFEPGHIPDGFYLVADAANPQLAFQSAIVAAVSRVTHIAAADERGEMIGEPMLAAGVIGYEMQKLGLCAGISGAKFTTTTEVYPDSPRTSPEQCSRAQVAAVCAGLDFLLKNAEPSL